MRVTVVIDVFRAFSVAPYVLREGPADYLLTASCDAVDRLSDTQPDAIRIGKPEIGSNVEYHIPNSPTRLLEMPLRGRIVIHRSQAGATGVLGSSSSHLVLAASFVNLSATARALRGVGQARIELMPMGHEATTPSLEDDLCASCLRALVQGEVPDFAGVRTALRHGPGRYFFGKDQWQYPREDFDRCLALDAVDFAVGAEHRGDHARLSRC